MGSKVDHVKVAIENLIGARSEFGKNRFANVGLLAIRSFEQMIEACAASEGLHFHERPATAHRERRDWLRRSHPDLVRSWDRHWAIYGALGYGGVDGEHAADAMTVLENAVRELSRRERIDVGNI